jgi:hypothetical protein
LTDGDVDEADFMTGFEVDLPAPIDAGTVQLLGARIEQVGPIRRCFVPLDSPFVVLYGLNGAGKSHVLRAIVAAFSPEANLGGGQIELHLRTEKFVSLARTAETNPWDPWQALWTGVRSYIDEMIPRRESPISTDQLTLDFYQHHLVNFLEEITGRPFDVPRNIGGLPPVLELISQLMIGADPNSYVNYDASSGEDAFNSEAAVFWPILEALLEGRLIVKVSNRGRTISLGRAQQGEATTAWATTLHEFVQSIVEPQILDQDPVDPLLQMISEITDPEVLSRLLEAVEARLGSVSTETETETETAEAAAADTEEADHDDELEPAELFERDGAAFLWDDLFGEWGPLAHCLQWNSVFASVLHVDPWPAWVADPVLIEGHDPGPPPFELLDESADWAELVTVQQLVSTRRRESMDPFLRTALDMMSTLEGDRSRQRIRVGRPEAFDPALLIVHADDGAFSVDPDLPEIASKLQASSNQIFAMLLHGAPKLHCRVAPIYSWSEAGPLEWVALDVAGAEIPLDSLSAAENRWAVFSIRLADLLEGRSESRPVVVLIDEPERALHRRAEHELADALAALTASFDVRLVVASHSPAFLSHRQASLQHVHRAHDGATIVHPVPQEFFERADALGLNPTDLLQLCRALLLVEGQHEIVILDELIGDELRRLGVEMLCMRGATSLKAWDAQLVQRYTDVPFVVLVDNDQSDRLRDIWTRARAAAERGEDHFGIIDELKAGSRGSEGEFLRELCKNLIVGADVDRYHIAAFDKADIPEYLPPAMIAPSVGDRSWEHLKTEAGAKASSSSQFKGWMKKSYGADYSDAALRAAAQSMDSIPRDFTDLLEDLASIVDPRFRSHPF